MPQQEFDVLYRKTIDKFLQVVDARFAKNPAGCPFVAGTPNPTIADCAMVAFL